MHIHLLINSKINYNAGYGVSERFFTQAAVDIVGLPAERIEVRRCIMMGPEFGRLTVYIYRADDEEKAYYRLNNGAVQHRFLSPNIYEFKAQLSAKIKLQHAA